jgi:hypothetical protein
MNVYSQELEESSSLRRQINSSNQYMKQSPNSVKEFLDLATTLENPFDAQGLFLDSVEYSFIELGLFKEYKKQIFGYDRSGIQNSYTLIDYQTESIGNPGPSTTKYEYSFNKDTSIFEVVTKELVHESGKWRPTNRSIRIRSPGNENSAFYIPSTQWVNGEEIFDAWIISRRTTRTFDSKGAELTRFIDRWGFYSFEDSEDAKWIPVQREFHTYDEFGRLISKSKHVSYTGELHLNEVEEYLYTPFRRTVSYWFYNPFDSNWDLYKRLEEYDKNDNLSTETIYQYRNQIQNRNEFDLPANNVSVFKWLPIWSTEWYYNSNNILSEVRSFEWIDEEQSFFNNHNTLYTKSEDGIDCIKEYRRNYPRGEFIESITKHKKDSIYNESKNILLILSYRWGNDQWIVTNRELRYYSQHTTTSLFDAAKVYPNPSSDYISFDFDGSNAYMHITIYDLKGNPLQSEYANVNSKVDISRLSKGTYVYKMVYDGQHYTGRIIKN